MKPCLFQNESCYSHQTSTGVSLIPRFRSLTTCNNSNPSIIYSFSVDKYIVSLSVSKEGEELDKSAELLTFHEAITNLVESEEQLVEEHKAIIQVWEGGTRGRAPTYTQISTLTNKTTHLQTTHLQTTHLQTTYRRTWNY